MGHAADGFSGILLLSEEHEFAFTTSCRETRNDLARNICKPYAYVYQCVRNHKSKIFRRNTKRPAINQHGRESLFHMGHAADGFSGILLLSEKHQFPISASCRETGNDVAGNLCRPCVYVYQRVCHHKSRIFHRNTKRPAVITQQGVV